MTTSAQLTGDWQLLDWVATADGGSVTRPFGDHPTGILVYSADGTMITTICPSERPRLASGDALVGGPDAERLRSAETFIAYSGRFHLEGEDVVHEVGMSLYPNWVGTRQVRHIRWSPDGATLELSTDPVTMQQGRAVQRLTWQRLGAAAGVEGHRPGSTDTRALERAHRIALDFLAGLPDRHVGATADAATLLERLGGPVPESGTDDARVVEELAAAVEPGLVATAGPRYFGFVIGGSVPAARAVDSLVGTWDQNAALFISSPAAAVTEAVTADWVLDLLGLPGTASVGFVTGGQMANFTCLVAARHAVLERVGWDVERDGLIGAPGVQLVVSAESHATMLAALRLAGLGSGRALRVPTDDQGRMRADALDRVLDGVSGPVIVCAQAGNVDTGAFDDIAGIAASTRARGAWLHVDGAFGLWAAASPSRRHLVSGLELADSWATDAHKWLNVPYDSGLAIVADPAAHHAAMTVRGAYLIRGRDGERDNHDWVPESSRRARGFAVYAAIRSMGRSGIADLVDRSCRLATRMAERIGEEPGVLILNDVVLNQVLVRIQPQDERDADDMTRAAIAGVQADGTCWLSGTRWHDQQAMRISVSGWSTTEADIDRSADAIRRVVRAVLAR